MDIPCLRWDGYLGNAAVAHAYHDLRALTSRGITLHASMLPMSFWSAWRDGILIFATVSSPTVHHGIVHELVHAILMEEGYCRPTWDDDTQTRGALSNELQHPEVFRRMEEYGLDMAPYWEDWKSKLGDGLDWLKSQAVEQVHFNFLQVFTWFFFPRASGCCLDEFRRFDPTVYNAACMAWDDAGQEGTSTAEAHSRFLTVFMRHWREFCRAHLPRNEQGRHVLRLLEDSRIECVRDKVNAKSEQFISEYLIKRGLV